MSLVPAPPEPSSEGLPIPWRDGSRLLLRPAGERAVLVDLVGDTGDGPERPVPEKERVGIDALGMAGRLRGLALTAGLPLREVVPGACTVLVECVDGNDLPRLARLVELAARETAPLIPTGVDAEPVRIEVVYDGPDLASVAAACGMSEAEVVHRHAAGHYRAAFAGFAPGFVYLEGLDERLWLARRSEARPAVPAGSVAVADRYSAVYPGPTPGGWHLLGRAAPAVWDPRRHPPALIAPGDAVRFGDATRRWQRGEK